jgi:putative ABC transport system ATP-binding protein
MEPVVRAADVRKTYRSGTTFEALRGIDLTVGYGELLAVTGPSGSGKTTLLNCLSGLERIDAGSVRIDGVELAELRDDARTDHRARQMGFVFQAFNLLPVLSAIENVDLPLLNLGWRPREARAMAQAMLARVGLADRADHRPAELSGGEQQRVAVARALVHQPAVIWADEPTGNLDTSATRSVMDLLVGLAGDGHTVVFVTHDAGLAALASRTIEVRDGLIAHDEVAPGPPPVTTVPV